MFDVVIVGGGPAGLSAALVLGRCRRRVLVCDAGEPRNAASAELHGYLTRDGIAPRDLLEIGRGELRKYGIEPRAIRVEDIHPRNGHFHLRLAGGDSVDAQMVLLATGVKDHVPDVPGLSECYGISAHHCPYCDGWEHRDQTIGVIGSGRSPAGLALSLRTWSRRIIVCASRRGRVSAEQHRQLTAQGIVVRPSPLARIEHDNGQATALVFADGSRDSCDAIFFTAPQSQQSTLAERLGCEFTRRGTVKTDHLGKTCVDGLFVVGDASRDVQFVVVAAAEGAKAGVAINQALQAREGRQLEAAS